MPIRGPKVKVSRALGLAITPKAAKVMERRSFSPGQHGMGRKRSPSVYKTQLVETSLYSLLELHSGSSVY